MGFEVRLMPVYDTGTRLLTDGARHLARAEDPSAVRRAFSGDVLMIASGPSAADFPLERYRHIPWAMMNGSVTLLEGGLDQPFLYICDDPNFVRERPHLALQGLQSAKFVAMSLDCLGELEYLYPGCLADARIIVLQRVNRLHRRALTSDRRYAWSVRHDADIECGFSLFKRKPNRIGFSRNLAKGYFGARTVPYAGLQIAFHLGLQRVFLVGVDLDAAGGRFYERGEQALPTTLDKDFSEYILPSFRLMAERVLKPGLFEVYNLAPGGRLPGILIPRITPEEFDGMLATARNTFAD